MSLVAVVMAGDGAVRPLPPALHEFLGMKHVWYTTGHGGDGWCRHCLHSFHGLLGVKHSWYVAANRRRTTFAETQRPISPPRRFYFKV